MYRGEEKKKYRQKPLRERRALERDGREASQGLETEAFKISLENNLKRIQDSLLHTTATKLIPSNYTQK